MDTIAVVLKQPEHVELNRLALTPPSADDVVVDVDWSGVSTGTERLLWSGRMPPFPGMGYPLVPGYEFGRPRGRSGICDRPASGPTRLRSRREMLRRSARPVRRLRVAPGGAGEARGAARSSNLGERGILLALAATAYHAIAARGASAPGLHRRPWRARAAAGAHLDRASATSRRRCGRKIRRASAAPSATAWSIPSTTRAATTRASTTSAAMPACSIR